jgi:glycosyltransferase involved in cell wall biosynthesis
MESRRMKLLYLLADDAFFWSHRLSMARAARAEGYAIHVAAPENGYRRRIEAEGFRFWPVRLRKSLNPVTGLLGWLDVLRVYRTVQPDLVHHVSMRPILWGGAASRLARVPAAVNLITGLGYVFISGPRWLRWVVEKGYRFSLSSPGATSVFQNPDDQRLFLDRRMAMPERCLLIPGDGVDMEVFAPRPEPAGQPAILLASRMLWDKGVGELVAAARTLRRRGVPHRIVLAGVPDRGNPAAVPEAVLRGWQEEGIVEWPGHVADIPAALGACAIACLPSYREGVPRALLEAASCARPIVATDVPGCRDIVQHGVNGLLVPPRQAELLADALEALLRDPARRRAMGEAGRRIVAARFSDQIVNRATLDLYSNCLAGCSPGGRPA